MLKEVKAMNKKKIVNRGPSCPKMEKQNKNGKERAVYVPESGEAE